MQYELTRSELAKALSCTIEALPPERSSQWRSLLNVEPLCDELFTGAERLSAAQVVERASARGPDAAARKLIERALHLHRLRGVPAAEQEEIDALDIVRHLWLDEPEIAPAVQRTPFGFIAVRLFASERDAMHIDELIRIHIWQAGERPPIQSMDTLVHSHELSARSWILSGQIINEQYDVRPTDGVASEYSLYSIGRDRYAKSVITNTGTEVARTLASRNRYSRGGSYEVPLGAYHLTDVAPEEYTATLFYFGNQPGWQRSYTVGPTSGFTFSTDHVRGYDELSASAVLDELLAHIR